ncbi:MAG: Trafficking protein particle complex subunit 33 [Cirrosporium novae-zelandiae]|nr:MAG: Trafficking protein particle complex subunit 33 [Cirrosporium novae-zelandiae]
MSFETLTPPYNASDPTARFLSSSCLDLLLIELVPLAQRLAASVSNPTPPHAPNSTTSIKNRPSSSGAGRGSSSDGVRGSGEGTRSSAAVGGGAGSTATSGVSGAGGLDEEDEREQVFLKLEGLGYRVGLGLVERFSRDRPRFTEQLDVIKFLCKDLWTLVFRKQIDNLKTNHRGTYVLTDHTFRPFSRMSLSKREEAVAKAQPYLWFPCGVIRGALASMGIEAQVQAETQELPGATFQIRTITTVGQKS